VDLGPGILDDINSPYGSYMGTFKDIVLNAHNKGERVFVTSNVSYENLMENAFVTDRQEKPRYMDRTKNMFKVLQVTGESRREQTAWHKENKKPKNPHSFRDFYKPSLN